MEGCHGVAVVRTVGICTSGCWQGRQYNVVAEGVPRDQIPARVDLVNDAINSRRCAAAAEVVVIVQMKPVFLQIYNAFLKSQHSSRSTQAKNYVTKYGVPNFKDGFWYGYDACGGIHAERSVIRRWIAQSRFSRLAQTIIWDQTSTQARN